MVLLKVNTPNFSKHLTVFGRIFFQTVFSVIARLKITIIILFEKKIIFISYNLIHRQQLFNVVTVLNDIKHLQSHILNLNNFLIISIGTQLWNYAIKIIYIISHS